MKLVRTLVLAVLVGEAYVPTAHAYLVTGNELHADCQSENLRCVAYIRGMLDMDRAYAPRHYFCIPPEATVGQLRDVIVQKLDAEPQSRHKPAAVLTIEALIAAFPC